MSKIGNVRVDIDRSLKPDVVASVFYLPFKNESFMTVVCDPPFDYLYHNSDLVGELERCSRYKIVVSHPPRNIVLGRNWVKSVFVTEQGSYFLRMWTIFKRGFVFNA